MKQKNLLITIVLILIVAGGAFFAGMQYQRSQSRQPAASSNRSGRFGQNGTIRFGGGNGGSVVGSIISVSGNMMTVKLANGSSRIVLLSSGTSINKANKASVSDLKTGQTVAAFGTPNSDGSVTAQSIQLDPIMRFPRTPRSN